MRNFIFSPIFILLAFNCIVKENIVNGVIEKDTTDSESKPGAIVLYEDIGNQQKNDQEASNDPLAIVPFEGAGNQQKNSQSTSKDPLGIADKEKPLLLTDETNPPFTVVKIWDRATKSYDYFLPSEILRGENGKTELSVIGARGTQEEKLCPETRLDYQQGLLNAVYKANPATKTCLFTTENDVKQCIEKPTPWLRKKREDQQSLESPIRTNCGAQKNHHLLVFEFNDCGSETDFVQYGHNALDEVRELGHERNVTPFKFRATYPMYEICYDFDANKTLWTRNQVLEPMLFFTPETPQDAERHIKLDSLSTSTYDLKIKTDTFESLKKKYQSDSTRLGMNPEYLVPPKHFAMSHWKTSARHFVNTAPLLPKFRRLMRVINEGLLKLSVRAFDYDGKKLHIFTKAMTNTNVYTPLITPLLNYIGLGPSEEHIAENIWYKFIYNETDKSAALITLYNYNELPKGTPCENTLACNFAKWLARQTTFTQKVLDFVGCTAISSTVAKELFQVDVEIKSTIDLTNLIKKFHTDFNLAFLKNNPKDSLDLVLQSELSDTSLEDEEGSPNTGENNLSLVPVDPSTPKQEVDTESHDPANEKSIVLT
ncbi:uncharacterized protein LOC135835425 [Planococcus citri]|uniref:uncharacterized protein LOC135835425 n=1 Tax=Planococcus citri TaxID=170843 RepID=UPI0031F95DE8